MCVHCLVRMGDCTTSLMSQFEFRGGALIKSESFGLYLIYCSILYTYILEVIQDFLIQLHVKPTKVPTICNNLSQKFF